MKKYIALALTALLLLSGCSNGKTPADGKNVTGKIVVYTRDSSSGTREAFEKLNDFEKQLTSDVVEASSNGDMATKVGNDKTGIGYVSLSTDFKANKVKPLQYNGVDASEETVLDGSYKLQRPFNFVTRADGDYESAEKQQLITAFIDYMKNSKEGMMVVEKAGGVVDVTKGTAWAELAKKHPIVTQDNSGITIVTGGSTSVEKTVKAALESFQPMAGNYKFTMNQSGSGDAYKRVLGAEKDGVNRADIGFASRAFNKDEDVSKALANDAYCIDAVVTIVNEGNNDFTSLTQEQIKSIFTGTVTKWEDVK